MTNENIIYVKNIHKAGKTVLNSKFGDLALEVKLVKGSKIYEIYIDHKPKAVTRCSPQDAWEWLSEYLGAVIHETPKKQPKPVRAPRKRKVYK